MGRPSGPVRRIVSRYFRCRFGGEGVWAEALRARVSVRAILWMRGWKFRVPFVFLDGCV